MFVHNDTLVNSHTDTMVTWNGQKGGNEGLRQGGWCGCGWLVLKRESKGRNTQSVTIAHGDSQLKVHKYTLTSTQTTEAVIREINKIWENNKDIMSRVATAIKALGLVINEVMTSADLLVYDKIIIFRRLKIIPETKRWARISSVTNDQLPSFSNSIAGCITGVLAVCQFSDTPFEIVKISTISLLVWWLH